VEILPYHTLGKHKYESLGWEYKLADTPHNTSEQLDRALDLFKEYFDCAIMN
jgi:pyruvate formate lyase activating enzyme